MEEKRWFFFFSKDIIAEDWYSILIQILFMVSDCCHNGRKEVDKYVGYLL